MHRGRNLDAREHLAQVIGAWGAHQDAMLHQRPHALLQKEGVALGAGDQQPLERRELRVLPEQGIQEVCGARLGQRIESELGIVALLAPAVLILGPVAHQEEHAGRRQALQEAI
jgi:hypothetical protein